MCANGVASGAVVFDQVERRVEGGDGLAPTLCGEVRIVRHTRVRARSVDCQADSTPASPTAGQVSGCLGGGRFWDQEEASEMSQRTMVLPREES